MSLITGNVAFMITSTQKIIINGSCTCVDEDGAPAIECRYICWDDALADFDNDVSDLFDASPNNEFAVTGLPLWNRDVSGVVQVDTSEELLRAITVNGPWTLRYFVKDTVLHCVLSHHDVPCGRSFTVTPVDTEEPECLWVVFTIYYG